MTIFSHVTRGGSVFVKSDTIFDCFFSGNYHNFILLFFKQQFHTSNFRKVVRQHTEGVARSII